MFAEDFWIADVGIGVGRIGVKDDWVEAERDGIAEGEVSGLIIGRGRHGDQRQRDRGKHSKDAKAPLHRIPPSSRVNLYGEPTVSDPN